MGGEKVKWSGYWDQRQRKLQAQPVNAALFASMASRMSGSALPVPVGADGGSTDADPISQIFDRCSIYFDGRVDGEEGLSSYALGKLAKLHGARIVPHLTKRGTTHVVCKQLSGSKERQALAETKRLYFVLPTWITQSVAAQRRLCESRFSLLSKVAQHAGMKLLELPPDVMRSQLWRCL